MVGNYEYSYQKYRTNTNNYHKKNSILKYASEINYQNQVKGLLAYLLSLNK